MNATRFHHVEIIAAVIGPSGVAFQTHHIVNAFQSMNVSVAQPSILNQLRSEPSYSALMSISGTNATKSGSPPAPSQPDESSNAETRLKIRRCFVDSFLFNRIIPANIRIREGNAKFI